MSETNFSTQLRNLSKEYYQNLISFEDYRAQRKIILDKIDEEFNGQHLNKAQSDSTDSQSIFMSTIQFFKNTDVE